MSLLTRIQAEHEEWSNHNFPDSKPYQALLGVSEEVGELCHAHLKQEQNIRNATDDLKKDAIGDIIIFLIHYCNLSGFCIESILTETWEQVRQRDWKENQTDGERG